MYSLLQDSILSSPLADEVEISTSANAVAVKKLGEKLQANSFKTPTKSSMIETNTEMAQQEEVEANKPTGNALLVSYLQVIMPLF